MNYIPESVIISRWYKALSQVQFGTLHFVSPSGTRMAFKGSLPGPEAEFAIAEWGVIRRMVLRGDIAMGEDYIAGKWTTDHIEQLFAFFLLNLESLERFANGNMIFRPLLALHNTWLRRNSRSGSTRNIRAHYDIGNEFYSLFLDPTMTYSSALNTAQLPNLADAQRAKYQRIIDRLEAKNLSILEVGCGWGGFAEHAAHRSHHVTGLTVSKAQHDFSIKRLGNAADIRLQDYRDVGGTFDAIVSIEMFEAVGEQYWSDYFNQLRARLNRGGKAVIQTITIRDDLFSAYRARSDFIRHYVFPGGLLPSKQRFTEEALRAGLRVNDTHCFGTDYAHTLRAWSERLRARTSDVLALGHNEAFLRNWHYYFGMCAAAFAVGRTDVAQIELVHA